MYWWTWRDFWLVPLARAYVRRTRDHTSWIGRYYWSRVDWPHGDPIAAGLPLPSPAAPVVAAMRARVRRQRGRGFDA